jgi:MSHA pilin protein MshD
MYTRYSNFSRVMRGVTLVELILFMVIVSVAVIGVLRVMGLTNTTSSDPMREKQALAIAESLLEEIQSQAFTYCDPDDANATAATSSLACASLVQGVGSTPGETRYGSPRFDNVGDYHGFSMKPIVDIQNQVIPGLQDYQADVSEVADLGGDRIRIDVTVTTGTGVDAVNVKLTGYRYRYAPRTVP